MRSRVATRAPSEALERLALRGADHDGDVAKTGLTAKPGAERPLTTTTTSRITPTV
jgi:hypothetical protein